MGGKVGYDLIIAQIQASNLSSTTSSLQRAAPILRLKEPGLSAAYRAAHDDGSDALAGAIALIKHERKRSKSKVAVKLLIFPQINLFKNIHESEPAFVGEDKKGVGGRRYLQCVIE